MAVFSTAGSSCGLCPAKSGFTHTHTHTHNVSRAHSLYISKAPPRWYWLLFLAAWKKRKLYVYFPLVLLHSCFVVGEVRMLCVTSVYSAGSSYCMLVRHLFAFLIIIIIIDRTSYVLGEIDRLFLSMFVAFFNSFNGKCSHLLLPNVWRQNKWRRKKRNACF